SSICKANKPACKDEVVVYHIEPVAGKSESVTINASKIVNNVAEEMGTLTCVVDEKVRTVTCPMPAKVRPGLWQFKWRGNHIRGTLTEPSGKLIRQIDLSRAQK
ncbi:MAG TPA: hypothetical protein VM100_07345, partial [Longimicrobiales bacterium]|nr:hypothetical protein [Longimicrobiales bacterium]